MDDNSTASSSPFDDKKQNTSSSFNHEEDEEMDSSKDKHIKLHIDMSSIPCISQHESAPELKELGVIAYDQGCYEQEVLKQIDETMKVHSSKNKEKTSLTKKKLEAVYSFPFNHQLNLTKETEAKDDDQCCNSQQEMQKDEENLELSDEDNQKDDESEKDKDYVPSDVDEYSDQEIKDEIDDVEEVDDNTNENNKRKIKHCTSLLKKLKTTCNEGVSIRRKKIIDDGNDVSYQRRINNYRKERLIEKHRCIMEDIEFQEFFDVDSVFRVPLSIWSKLYSYQQTGVKWLWELHQLSCGGIIGDEMGLGKTIQIIAFLAGLSVSRVSNFREERESLGPVLLVCPATVMYQWVAEFHSWWPPFRVAILHHTGQFKGRKETLIRAINRCNGILITSYSSIVSYQDILYKYDWHYVILDEGHKIRNPDAQTTLACKMFHTPHRIILSGSPIQNNLKELWSLFDFIYPGKLGTLPVFMEKFSVPITQGGYSNASQIQVEVAFKCATVLRDAIKPYLLRRVKDEVQMTLNLPNKNEQVLFCRLTNEQKDLYKAYLDSPVIKDIFKGSTQIFVGLINLRKICNHPDLFTNGPKEESEDVKETFGYYKRSSKMKVVNVLLELWFKQGHKVLFFTQGKQMLNIIEKFLKYREYNYLKMDGSTPIASRQNLVTEFNNNKDVFIFLLTTRVGGIGLNLIGANRVLIYDPDWNPTTDMQARERAWRIGQNRQVTIYRLLTAGTVEEKIYHRQVFKQYLTNRVLKDPKQRRFFKTNDLYELFSLGNDSNETESSAIFAGTGSKVKINKKAKNPKIKDSHQADELVQTTSLPPEKIQELREQAKRLSKMIANKFKNKIGNNGDACSSDNTAKETLEGGQQPSLQTDASDKSKLESNNTKKFNLDKVKSKSKGSMFEGKRIKYLVKSDDYKSDNIKHEEALSKKQDDYVLNKLFKKSHMHSALKHDVIEGASNPDFALVESEANKVANEAINALKKSRQLYFEDSSRPFGFIKTQKHIVSKKPSFNTNHQMSSASLINAIKERNKFEKNYNEDDDDDGYSDERERSGQSEYRELLDDIRSFVAFQASVDGEATTQELLDFFKSKLPPEQTPVFKSLLWKVCDFHRRSDKTGVWRLRSEFR